MAYKQRCVLCKKNNVLINNRRQRPLCIDCEMNDLFEPIEDLKFQKLFDIDKSLYQESRFLRDIRYRYNKLGFLSVNQINAFKKAVNDLKDPKKNMIGINTKKRVKKKESLKLTFEEKKMLGLE